MDDTTLSVDLSVLQRLAEDVVKNQSKARALEQQAAAFHSRAESVEEALLDMIKAKNIPSLFRVGNILIDTYDSSNPIISVSDSKARPPTKNSPQ